MTPAQILLVAGERGHERVEGLLCGLVGPDAPAERSRSAEQLEALALTAHGFPFWAARASLRSSAAEGLLRPK